MAFGIPSVFVFLPRKINTPFRRCPIRTGIAAISLDISYVGRDKVLHTNSHFAHKMTFSQESMTVLWIMIASKRGYDQEIFLNTMLRNTTYCQEID